MKAIYNPIPKSDVHNEVEILEQCPCDNWAKIRMEDGKTRWVMTHYISRHQPHEERGKYKTIRSSHYSPDYLNENIFTDWRCFDEKQIETGDRLTIVNDEGKYLANGTVLWVKQTKFGTLSDEDKKGHREFLNDKHMYETYQKYYGRAITKDTPVKVLRIQIDKQ